MGWDPSGESRLFPQFQWKPPIITMITIIIVTAIIIIIGNIYHVNYTHLRVVTTNMYFFTSRSRQNKPAWALVSITMICIHI